MLSEIALSLALTCNPANGTDAREFIVSGVHASYAYEAWDTALATGGAIAWTATLYDVDARSVFLMAFDREGIRIYRRGAFDDATFERAWGGCIDDRVPPEADIPWRDVREIKSGNWVHYFKLNRPVTIKSDRGKTKTVDEVKVNLHGGTGTYEVHVTRDALEPYAWWKDDVRVFGMGPLSYNERVRWTLIKFFDPERHIATPKASRSAGW